MTTTKGVRSTEPETRDVADEAKWIGLARALTEVEGLMAARPDLWPGLSALAIRHHPAGRTPPNH